MAKLPRVPTHEDTRVRRGLRSTSKALGSGGGPLTVVVMPGEFAESQAGSTLTISWAAENPNTVFAGPTLGAAGTPKFRTLVAADIPVGPSVSSTVYIASSSDLGILQSKFRLLLRAFLELTGIVPVGLESEIPFLYTEPISPLVPQ